MLYVNIYSNKSGDTMNLLQRIKYLLEGNETKKATSIVNSKKGTITNSTKKPLSDLFYNKAKRLYDGKLSSDEAIKLLNIAISLRNTYQANELLGDIYYEKGKDKETLLLVVKYYKEAYKGLKEIQKRVEKSSKIEKKLERVKSKLEQVNDELTKSKPMEVVKKPIKKPIIRDERNIIDIANIYATGAQVVRAEKELKQVKFNPENLDLQEVLLKLDLVKGNYLDAEERIEQMLDLDLSDKKYIELVIKLSRLCVTNERYQDAFYMLRVLYKKYPKNSEVIMEIINFYITTKNYEHALYIIENYSRDFDNYMKDYVTKTLYYLRHVLGIKQSHEDKKEEYTESYFERQVREYSEKKCIDYNDLTYKNVDRTSLKPMLMSKTENVYNRLREGIVNLKPIYRGLTDLYIVDLRRELGRVYNMNTSMFEVETISNTKDILTFKPIGREYKGNSKAKRMS